MSSARKDSSLAHRRLIVPVALWHKCPSHVITHVLAYFDDEGVLVVVTASGDGELVLWRSNDKHVRLCAMGWRK